MKIKSPGVVARSAFRFGRLAAVQLRPSHHARSGVVVVCSFSSPWRAGAFAALWARRLSLSVKCRCQGGFWSVSVPVKTHTVLPAGAGRRVAVSGGVRGLRHSLVQGGCAF